MLSVRVGWFSRLLVDRGSMIVGMWNINDCRGLRVFVRLLRLLMRVSVLIPVSLQSEEFLFYVKMGLYRN